ncbi:UNVERIFIED_CONTAM: hypothetical protein K2H54_011415 [Gekko kuhli]
MRAVGELRFQPPISRDLRTLMVAWALGLVLGGRMLEARQLRSSFGESCVPQLRQEESQETVSLFGS